MGREAQQASQDVWEHSTAARGRGAAEKGGEHQEDLGQSGCGGYQAVRGGAERRRSSAPRLPRQKHKSLQGKVLMLRPVRTQDIFLHSFISKSQNMSSISMKSL